MEKQPLESAAIKVTHCFSEWVWNAINYFDWYCLQVTSD